MLDGVNELLLGSYKSQVYEIFGSHLVSCSRIITFSTTLPKELKEFQDDFMNETVQIIVKKDDLHLQGNRISAQFLSCILEACFYHSSVSGLKQFYLMFDDCKKKFNLLSSLCKTFSSVRVIIHCNNRRNVDELSMQMERSGLSALSMVSCKYKCLDSAWF